MLGPNTIIPYDSTHASIPSGWTRDTSFDDGKMPKGASSGWGDAGGASDHDHSVAHTHTTATHTHTVSVGNRVDGDTYGMGGSGSRSGQGHTHYGQGTTGNSGTEACQSTTATLVASANEPPYYEVIFIKSSGWSFIPQNAMIYRTSARSGMTYHSASENKFLRGAGTDQDAGGTGGATTHTHTQSHTHTANAHSHATGYVAYDQGDGEDGGDGPALSNQWHRHTIATATGTQNMNTNSDNSASSGIEPYHKTFLHYKAGASVMPIVGDIVMTTETDNPPGWSTCDGTNGTPEMVGFYIKNTQSYNTIAGSNTHTHTLNHSHTGNGGHTHTITSPSGYADNVTGGRTGSGKDGVTTHRHSLTTTSGSTTANYNATNATSSEENNEPEYVKVRFIQMKFQAIGGGIMQAIL